MRFEETPGQPYLSNPIDQDDSFFWFNHIDRDPIIPRLVCIQVVPQDNPIYRIEISYMYNIFKLLYILLVYVTPR